MKSVPLHAAELSLNRTGRLPAASAMYMLPDWLHEPFSWAQHIPFAFWIMETHRPSVVVELGTHYANSYFAFCQAAAALQIPAACYAVDTWQGDEHAGFYGEEVYEAVERHNRARYDVFSRLVRSTFDEARPHFADGSIDLLHIDGLHTYEACKHDFDNWLPALSDRGVVLLHDTNVRERNFGVGKLWSELRERYPHFEFSHSHGLGIVGVGENIPETLKELFSAERNDRIATSTRHIFWRVGAALTVQAALDAQADALAQKGSESVDKDEELQRKGAELERRAEEIARKTEQLTRQAEALTRNGEELARQQDEIAARGQALAVKDEAIAAKDHALAEKDQLRAAKDAAIAAKDHALAEKDQLIAAKDEAIAAKDHALAEKDQLIVAKDEAIAAKDHALAEKDQLIVAKDEALGRLQAELARKDTEISEVSERLQRAEAAQQKQSVRVQELETERARLLALESELRARCRELERAAQSALKEHERAEQDTSELRGRLSAAYDRISDVEAAGRARAKELGDLQSAVALKTAHGASLSIALADAESTNAKLANSLAEVDRALSEAKFQLKEREKGIERLKREKRELKEEAHLHYQGLIAHFRNSTSWKVTRPLRALKQLLPTHAPQILGAPLNIRAMSDDAATVIAESGLFDAAYYLARAGTAIRDPIAHYLEYGHKDGLNPNPLFDSDYYSTLYAAHLDDTANPLLHFIQAGSQQGFDPSRLFQTQFYLQANPAVTNLSIMPLLHYLTVGRVTGLMPIDVDIGKLDPRALQLHRLDISRTDGDEFDAELYAELYPEASGDDRSPAGLQQHYETVGRAEDRIGSPRAFLQSVKMPPEAVPINFTPSEYYELNGDLGRVLPCTFYLALRHYLEFGIREGRRYSFSQCYIDAQWRQETLPALAAKPKADAAGKRIACLVHVYYADLWPELCAYLSNLEPGSRDVYVNITDSVWTERLHVQIRSDVPDARIVISENRGRDIGGHLNSLKGVRIDDYAAFVLLHTKKSRHLSDKYSETWRNSLLDPLMGTPEKVLANLALLNSDPTIGIIGAAAWRHSRVDSNAANYKYLLRKAGLDQDDTCDFVSGTMMIVRSEVMKRLYDLLADEEFENADGKSIDWLRDGQLEHAAERLFGNMNKALGYRIQWR